MRIEFESDPIEFITITNTGNNKLSKIEWIQLVSTINQLVSSHHYPSNHQFNHHYQMNHPYSIYHPLNFAFNGTNLNHNQLNMDSCDSFRTCPNEFHPQQMINNPYQKMKRILFYLSSAGHLFGVDSVTNKPVINHITKKLSFSEADIYELIIRLSKTDEKITHPLVLTVNTLEPKLKTNEVHISLIELNEIFKSLHKKGLISLNSDSQSKFKPNDEVYKLKWYVSLFRNEPDPNPLSSAIDDIIKKCCQSQTLSRNIEYQFVIDCMQLLKPFITYNLLAYCKNPVEVPVEIVNRVVEYYTNIVIKLSLNHP